MKAGQSAGISWVVPVDDSHYVLAMAMKLPAGSPRWEMRLNGKTWGEMTDAEHQRIPGDYEAQAGQGPISLHSEEHLVTSDRGIMMQRKMLQQQIEIVAKGGDPLGRQFRSASRPWSGCVPATSTGRRARPAEARLQDRQLEDSSRRHSSAGSVASRA